MITDASNPRHWFDFAEEDLRRAHRRFAEADYADCVFHLLQSAEKVMKGKLIACGWNLRRTHDLAPLIVALGSYQIDCSWFDPIADVLATEYIADRYPGFAHQPPSPLALRGFILVRVFELLSSRQYTGPQLPPATTP